MLAKKNATLALKFFKRRRIRIFFGCYLLGCRTGASVADYHNLGQAFLFQLNDSRGQKDHQFIFVFAFPLIFKQPAQEG